MTLPDGSTRVETKFTRLTGRSPILLAGMTPTTVDPAIVAAAANAGFWAELAGGGQVTEPIFAANVERLDALLDDGRTYAFNSLFLDPYLWRLQIGGRKLVQRARAAGSAVDAVVVTAGIPDLDDAVALTEDLRAAGIEYVVFKPGTVEQIRQVLAIADALAPMDVIVQIEGGKAGGHHSDEDLDQLLIETYGKLRQRDNIVVCVGGGIGTPQDAVRYLTGSWSVDLGFPAMPLDGVLVGTAAMATLEATTSPRSSNCWSRPRPTRSSPAAASSVRQSTRSTMPRPAPAACSTRWPATPTPWPAGATRSSRRSTARRSRTSAMSRP